MSRSLRITFVLHAVVAFVFGLGLLIIPGRLLELFNWRPIDPLISRMLGAALVGLGWGSYRGWRANLLEEVEILLQVEAVFTVLACVGLLRHLLVASFPWYVWMIFAIYAIFAIAWVYHLIRRE